MPDESESDAALVEAARSGEKAAFAVLLARHRPLLVALCRRVLVDADAVEDVVQEAALQALLHLDRLRRPERFGSWLGGIGLNLARRSRRGRGDWSWEAVVGGRAGAEPVDQGPGPAEAAEGAELAERVRSAVAALPAGQRSAVLLVYLGGMTQAEAAAQLGVESGAVKTRLHKARRTLRRTLLATWRETTMATTTTTTMEQELVEVAVVDVRRTAATAGRAPHLVAILGERGGGRRLPIWMGEFEGTAIALHLEGVEVPRPPTYAFAAKVLAAAGGGLREVRIVRLEGEVYYAVAVVDGPGGAAEVDARPSDALNLALLAGAPIRVGESVFAASDAAAGSAEARAAVLAGTGLDDAAQIAADARARWERQSEGVAEGTMP